MKLFPKTGVLTFAACRVPFHFQKKSFGDGLGTKIAVE
jgi:hypothetical protein